MVSIHPLISVYSLILLLRHEVVMGSLIFVIVVSTVAVLQAPMSARKYAWEAKIAEQQSVATEHNRIMYRTRSATRLGADACQKQQAESQLRQGQQKAYDPAERARKERQAELEALQNRFNSKGLLKSESEPQQAKPAPPPQPMATSLDSVGKREIV